MNIVLNTDTELVRFIREQLEENNGFCPCSLVKNDDTICMCRDFLESKELGLCHCGLYNKIEL